MKIFLDKAAIRPTRAHSTDAGIDLYSREEKAIKAHSSQNFHTGVHVELPHGTAGLLVSKSGLNVKHGITSTGLIDEGFTGEIVVKLYNDSDEDYIVLEGDKISQLVVIPVIFEGLTFVDDIVYFDLDTERGSDGYGSTGR